MRLRILLLALAICLLLTDAAQAQRGRGGRWGGGWDGGWSWDLGWDGPYYGGYYGSPYYGGYYRPGGYYYAPEIVYDQPPTGIDRASATVNAPTALRITEVLDGGAAKKANLRPGDVITAVGSSRTQTFGEFQKALATNGEVELTYLNGATGKLDKAKLTPNDGKIGVAVVPTYYYAPAMPMQSSTGVVQTSAMVNAPVGLRITEVLDGGAAKKANLRPGDFITAVGSSKTQTFEELQKALAAANGEVDVTYLRPGTMNLEKVKLTPNGGKIGVAVLPTYLPN